MGLPVEVRGVEGSVLIEWAKRIDSGPFNTVAVTDAIVDPAFESLTTLAAAASVTRRVRLMTVVIGSPPRNTALLAKQAATIDALSGGRLSLGLGVGELVEDFAASGVEMKGRGKRFEEQLTELKRIWSGGLVGESGKPLGPEPHQPGGPELLIGGWAERAIARVGRFGDGYVGAALTEDLVTDREYQIALRSWKEHGRDGKPRFVQNVYFALGDEAKNDREAFLRHSYEGSPEYDLEAIARVTPTTEQEIRDIAGRIEATGADELIFHSVNADIEQIARLEQALF